jgi:hypothetical protein
MWFQESRLFCYSFHIDVDMRIRKIRCAIATTIALLFVFFIVPALPTYFVIFAYRHPHSQQQLQQQQLLPRQQQQLVPQQQQQQQLPQQQLHQHQYQQKVGDTYLSAVSRQASADKYIILSVVDEPITDMAINLYETSFKPYNIRNFLFVGFGAQTCIVLSAVSLPCFHYANFNNTQEKASVFNSVEFLTKMTVRNRIVMETLRAGFNVLLTDLDIIFLQNPLPEIKVGLLLSRI